MSFPVYSPQNLSLPPVRQLPEDVRNPLAGLSDIIAEIAKGQQQRKLDQMKLEEARMTLAEKQRQAAQDAAFQAEIRAIGGATVPEATGFNADMGQGLSPFSPIPLMPDVTSRQRPLTSEEARTRIQQALLKTGQGGKYLDTIRQIELPMDKMERSAMSAEAQIRRSLLTSKDGLKNAARAGVLNKYFPDADPDELQDAPPSTEFKEYESDAGTILYYDDPSGKRHIVSKPTAAMLSSRDPEVKAFAEWKMRAQGQVQIGVGQALGTNMVPQQDARGGFNLTNKATGVSMPVVTAPNPVTQPVTPGAGQPLPSTLPPGIRTPAPAPSGSGAFMPSAQDKAAMDAKVLADPGAEPIHNVVSTGTVPLDMSGAPTATSTMPLYGEQLMGKAPNAPEDDFQKEQVKAWNAFEKEYKEYLVNESQTQNIVAATEGLMKKMGPNDVLPPDQAGVVITQLYQIAKSRDPKTGVRMPEITLDAEYMSKLQQFSNLLNSVQNVPITRVQLQSLKNAAIQLSKADAEVIQRARMRKKKGLEALFGRPATGLGGAWDLNASDAGALATASGTYDPRKVW